MKPTLQSTEPDADVLARLKTECSVCEKCGHVQAEPNWCHACGHRTRHPEWAKKLLHELQQAMDWKYAAEDRMSTMAADIRGVLAKNDELEGTDG